MKSILIFGLLFGLPSIVWAQSEHKNINGTDFIFKFEDREGPIGNSKEIVLYRGNKKLLTHTAYIRDGDSSSGCVELGKYSIITNQITFYSYWGYYDRMPNNVMKYGFRKQVYKVDSNGYIHLNEAEIYLEDPFRPMIAKQQYFSENNPYFHQGFYYLQSEATTAFEKEALQAYMDLIGKEKKAKFVLGTKKDKLEIEIRAALKGEIEAITGEWIAGEAYGFVKK